MPNALLVVRTPKGTKIHAFSASAQDGDAVITLLLGGDCGTHWEECFVCARAVEECDSEKKILSHML